MKKILFMIILINTLFGVTKNDIYTFYKNKDYKNTCLKGVWILNKFKDNDTYQSIVALSCVKVNMLNASIKIAKTMIHTPIGRNNASYISSLFLIKKLLLQKLYDNINISNLSFPKSNHPLSIVFENISHNNFTRKEDKYTIYYQNKKYLLYPIKTNKFVIEIYKNNMLLSKKTYW